MSTRLQTEQNAQLSKDGLAIYFSSDRPGGFGALDIYVTRRASLDSPWEPPVNLGPLVNTPFGVSHPTSPSTGICSLSFEGLTMLLGSNRLGSMGSNDIGMTTRRRR